MYARFGGSVTRSTVLLGVDPDPNDPLGTFVYGIAERLVGHEHGWAKPLLVAATTNGALAGPTGRGVELEHVAAGERVGVEHDVEEERDGHEVQLCLPVQPEQQRDHRRDGAESDGDGRRRGEDGVVPLQQATPTGVAVANTRK
jgi:hypothetical protein